MLSASDDHAHDRVNIFPEDHEWRSIRGGSSYDYIVTKQPMGLYRKSVLAVVRELRLCRFRHDFGTHPSGRPRFPASARPVVS